MTMKKYVLGATAVCLLSVLVYRNVSTIPDIPGGTVILICGASSGIGEELAYQAAEKGANLVLAARSEDKLLRVQEEALKRGAGAVEIVPADFSDVAGSGVVVEKTLEKFGKLDYLVLNHAGLPFGPFLAAEYMHDPAFIEKIMKVNFLSHIEIALKALPHLEGSSGHIYVTSSTFGEVPINYAMSLYCTSKHALNGFFYSLQQELLAKESSVSVTVGALGLIWTPDIASVFENDPIPKDVIAGTMEGAARGMLDSYTTRPRTLTYPVFANVFMRLLWYFNPYFHEMMISQNKPRGSEGNGYDANVADWKEKTEIASKRRFMQGYQKDHQPSA
ncbi:hypothetical protein ACHWQZ_G008927 [Mnemiopsis leidyi]